MKNLDDKDRDILKLLKEDCRKSYVEIAEAVGISRVAVKNRIDAMEAGGIIKGYKLILDDKNTPTSIEFFMDIEVEPSLYDSVAEGLAKKPVVKRITGATGDTRLHVTGIAPDKESMEKYTNSLFYQLGGIRKISIHTVFSVLYDEEAGVEYDKHRGEKTN